MQSDSDAPQILIVEDDLEIARMVSASLSKNDFVARTARDWAGAMAAFESQIPDLVILDVMLPGDDGFTILRRIRKRFDTPIIMLTARSAPDDRVKGLTVGADDYVVKPFHSAELIARVRSVLRRHHSPATRHEATGGDVSYSFDGWTVDTRKRRISDASGVVVVLTSGEFDVLECLCANAGTILSRDRLAELSQNRMVEPYDRSIDTLVSRIRRKVSQHSGGTDIIKTVRNKGYVFTPTVTVMGQ